jgi:hypothetical protein
VTPCPHAGAPLPHADRRRRGAQHLEASELEAFIQRMYDQTDTFIDEHPFEDADQGD